MTMRGKHKQFAALFLVAISVVCGLDLQGQQKPAPPDLSQYVGLRHGHELPQGLVHVGGGMISDPYKDKTNFGMAQVTRGRTNMIWFELFTHHDAEGKAHWEVLDVVATPPLRKNQYVMVTLCLFNNKPDPEIAAVVEPVRRSYDMRVIKAWRANRVTRKLEAISLKGVRCEMQGDD